MNAFFIEIEIVSISMALYLYSYIHQVDLGEFVLHIHHKCVYQTCSLTPHYSDVIMGAMASQITSLTIVYSTVYSGTDQRKRQSSASLAFVRGIQRWPVNSPHKWPVTRKMFPFDYVIMGTVEWQIQWRWSYVTWSYWGLGTPYGVTVLGNHRFRRWFNVV